ncbi:MAG: hypothetical protein ACTSXO_06935 [Candidatus Heimdallarchaeota archaeon]
MKKEKLGLVGWVEIKHRDKEGNLIQEVVTPNCLTNTGFAEVAGLITSDQASSHTAFDYIAIGTGTTAATATDTQLEAEITDAGGARTAATGTLDTVNVSNDTMKLVATFNFTGSKAVTESGVFNASSGGVMLCRQTFSAINVANGDSLEVTWKVTVA